MHECLASINLKILIIALVRLFDGGASLSMCSDPNKIIEVSRNKRAFD
jgi:hypothetical protein